MCLDYNKIKELPDNVLIKCNPELYDEWNFEKNNELGLDIWKMTKGMTKKVWWNCKKCESSYLSTPAHRREGKGCSYCSGQKVNHTNSLASLNPNLSSEWNYEKNELTPDEVTPNKNKKVWWMCGLGHEWEADISSRNSGCGCPYCSGLLITKENSLPYLFPNLFSEWDFENNKSLDPWKIGKGYGKKVWWICPKCENSYDASPNNRTSKGRSCPYCSGQKVNNENCLATLNPELASEWHPTKNGDLTPNDITCGSGQKAWWLGECGHEWESTISSRDKGVGCPYCANYSARVLKGFNDMWTTNPELASQLLNHEDGYKYLEGSAKVLDWKCFTCNCIIKKRPVDVLRNGLCCRNCSDNISYSQKFVTNLLRTLDVEFTTEVSFEWSDNKIYDFYIPSLNLIIETHGIQHYEERGFTICGGRTLKEEQENDRYKREMAIKNGISTYIELDCRESEMKWIRKSIMSSEMVKYFKLKDVKWEYIASVSQKSLVVRTWDMYKEGVSRENIMKELNISKGALDTYLRKGRNLNLIGFNNKPVRNILKLTMDYELVEEMDNFSRSYIDMNRKGQILRVLKGERTHFKGFRYMYKEDYDKLIAEQY